MRQEADDRGEAARGAVRPVGLVTGAAGGLGRAIAEALAGAGYDLVLADLRTEGFSDQASALEALGARVLGLPRDLREEASVRETIARAEAEGLTPDLLVNNAGLALHRPAVEIGWDEWDALAEVNLKGAFFLSCALARRLIARRRPGAVVNIASAHGLVGIAGRAAYGISKAGMIHMGRMLAIEWAAHAIRVNAVAPGTVMTPSREALLAAPGAREAMLARIPSGRFPGEGEVAAAVVYLASPAAASVTGQVLAVDGGTTVW